MNIGMMWYDYSKKPVADRIAKAVAYYNEKYELPATVVYVNPKMLEDNPDLSSLSVKVETSKHTMMNHFWVGRE